MYEMPDNRIEELKRKYEEKHGFPPNAVMIGEGIAEFLPSSCVQKLPDGRTLVAGLTPYYSKQHESILMVFNTSM